MKRFACLLLMVVMLFTAISAGLGDSYRTPSGLKEWSPGYVEDFWQYYMNFDAVDKDTGDFVDTSARLYRRWLDGKFETGDEYASTSGSYAGNFGKFWGIPTDINIMDLLSSTIPGIDKIIEFIKGSPLSEDAILSDIKLGRISFEITRTDPNYRIPTGRLDYTTKLDYAGLPSWAKTLLKYGKSAAEAVLSFVPGGQAIIAVLDVVDSLIKSGLPVVDAVRDGNLSATLRSRDFNWSSPGKAKYWIEAHLTRKTFRTSQILLKAEEGLNTVKFEVSDSKDNPVSYWMHYDTELEGYVCDRDVVLPVNDNYCFTIHTDGHTYHLGVAINGFSAPRDEHGMASKSGYAALNEDQKNAIQSTSYGKYYSGADGQKLAERKSNGEPIDNDWHMAEVKDASGIIWVENPESLDMHIFRMSSAVAVTLESIWIKDYTGVNPPAPIYVKLYKIDSEGEKQYYNSVDVKSWGDIKLKDALLFDMTTNCIQERNDYSDTYRKTYSLTDSVLTFPDMTLFLRDAVSLGLEQCDALGNPLTYDMYRDVTHNLIVDSDGITVQIINHVTNSIRFRLVDEDGTVISDDNFGIAQMICEGKSAPESISVTYDEAENTYETGKLKANLLYQFEAKTLPSDVFQTFTDRGPRWRFRIDAHTSTILFAPNNDAAGPVYYDEEEGVWNLTLKYRTDAVNPLTITKEWESGSPTEDIEGVSVHVEEYFDGEIAFEASVELTAANNWKKTIHIPRPSDDEYGVLNIYEEDYILEDGYSSIECDWYEDVDRARISVSANGTQLENAIGSARVSIDSEEADYQATVTNLLKAVRIVKTDGAAVLTPKDRIEFRRYDLDQHQYVTIPYDEQEGCFRVNWDGHSIMLINECMYDETIDEKEGEPRPVYVTGTWEIDFDEHGTVTDISGQFFPAYEVGKIPGSAEIDPTETNKIRIKNPATPFKATIKKTWTEEPAEEIDSVVVMYAPILKQLEDGSYIAVNNADEYAVNAVELKRDRNWESEELQLPDGYVYLVLENFFQDKEGAMLPVEVFTRYNDTYTDGKGVSEWTFTVDGEEITYQGEWAGILQNLKNDDEDRTICNITNGDRVFHVSIDWQDQDNANVSRPSNVHVVLQKKTTDAESGEAVWTDVENGDVVLPKRESGAEGDPWEGKNAYTYAFSDVDIDVTGNVEYRVRVKVLNTETEQQEYELKPENCVIISDMSTDGGSLWQEDRQGDKCYPYHVSYKDELNQQMRHQNITLTLRSRINATVEWLDKENDDEVRPDKVTVQLQKKVTTKDKDGKETESWVAVSDNGQVLQKEISAFKDENGIGKGECVFNAPYEKDAVYRVCVVSGEKKEHVITFSENSLYKEGFFDDASNPITTLTLQQTVSVEKKWKIDVENLDQPDELAVILQKKVGDDEWSDPVESMTLKRNAEWKGSFKPVDTYSIEQDGSEKQENGHYTKIKWSDKAEYRVREISAAKLREMVKGYISNITDMLPDFIKGFVDEVISVDTIMDWVLDKTENIDIPDGGTGAADTVKENIRNWLKDNVPDDGDDITLKVPSRTSVVQGGQIDEHETKYMVSYKTDGNTTTITNTAILDITIIKKWAMFGTAKDKIPDSVHVMLLSRSKSKIQETAEDAGVPFANTYIPVYRVKVLGIDTGLYISGDGMEFNFLEQKLAIAIAEISGPKDSDEGESDEKGQEVNALKKGDDEKEWRADFRVYKYNDAGLEQEYKGAELISGIISEIGNLIGNMLGVSEIANLVNYISVNPIDGYLSASTIAMKIPSSIPLIGSDSHLYSGIINTWIGFDSDRTIGGIKTWNDNGNKNGLRPEKVTLHIYEKDEDGKETELGTTETTAGDNWVWKFCEYKDPQTGEDKKLDKNKIAAGYYIVREDPVPEGYTVSYNGYEVINTMPSSYNLTVTNTVYNSGEGVDPEFTYTVTLSVPEGADDKPVAKYNAIMKGRDGDTTLALVPDEQGKVTFKLRSGEQMSIVGLPLGTTYKVLQEQADGWLTTITGVADGRLKNDVRIDALNAKPIIVNGHKTIEGEQPKAYEKDRFTFQLSAFGTAVGEATNGDDGAFSFTYVPKDWKNLPDKLTVKETKLPAEYKAEKEAYDIPLKAQKDANGILQVKTDELVVNNLLKRMDITVVKVWQGEPADHVTFTLVGNAPGSKTSVRLTITLKPDTEGVTVSKDSDGYDTWTYTLKDQARFVRMANAVIPYNWYIEEEVPSGFEADYSRKTDDGTGNTTFTITNHAHTLRITKVWEEGTPEVSSVEAIVTRKDADGNTTEETVSITEENDWVYSHQMTDEELYYSDATGKRQSYTYSVKEVPVSGWYSHVDQEEDHHFTITNSTKPVLTVNKVWEDDDNANGMRPDSVIVTIDHDNQDTLYILLNEENDWHAEIRDLEDEDLKNYTIREMKVTGYSSEITTDEDHYAVILTNRADPNPKLTITKIWKDNNNAANTRPSSISLTIKRSENGANQVTGTVVLQPDTDGNWKFTQELKDTEPFYRASYTDTEGKKQAYTYTISEAPVDGYQVTVTNDGFDFTLTNTLANRTVLTVQKVWDDENNKAGIRPESINLVIRRTAYGTEVGTVDQFWKETVTAENELDGDPNSWIVTFPGFEEAYVDANGTKHPYTYSVEEITVDGYTTTMQASGSNFTITNKIAESQPDPGVLKITKVWQDNDDEKRARPDSIGVRVTRHCVTSDGKTADKSEMVNISSRDGVWEFETELNNNNDFFRLNDTETGNPYTYTVAEEAVPEGYVCYTESNGNQFKLTNIWIDSSEMELRITKVWEDYENSFNTRPTSVDVVVYRVEDQRTKTIQISENTEGAWVFKTDLDNSDDFFKRYYTDSEGAVHLYTYTAGDAVNGYKCYLVKDGYNLELTNVLDLPAELKITKRWIDHQNADGKRPDSIKVWINRRAQDTQYGDVFESWTEQITSADATASDNNVWEHVITGLEPAYVDDDGTEHTYVYSVGEIPVSGYVTRMTSGVDGYEMTNILPSQQTVLNGKKIWIAPAGVQIPDSVKIICEGYTLDEATGAAVCRIRRSADVTAKDEWKYSFSVPETIDGKKLEWMIREELPEGTEGFRLLEIRSVSETEHDIVNIYEGEHAVLLLKLWKDLGEAYRPDEVNFRLIGTANGKPVSMQDITMTKQDEVEEDVWFGYCMDLPQWYYFEDNVPVEIEYSIDEMPVDGYDSATYLLYNTLLIAGNELKTGNVTVSNTVLNGNPERSFLYTLTVKDRNGSLYSGFIGEDELKDGKLTFTLKHNESRSFTGIPLGWTAEVIQQPAQDYLTTCSTTKDVVATEIDADTEYRFFNNLQMKLTAEKTVDNAVSPEAAFDFIFEMKDQNGIIQDTATNAADGSVVFTPTTGLTTDQIIYTLTETTLKDVQDKYIFDTEAKQITVTFPTGVDEPGYIATPEKVTFRNRTKTSVTVTKDWEDGRTDSVSLILYANGEELIGYPAVRDGSTYTFSGMPYADEEGNPVEYSVREISVTGYQTIYRNTGDYANRTKAAYDGGTIVNRPTEEDTETFTFTKVWKNTSEKPDIQLVIWKGDQEYKTITRSANESGRYTLYLPSTEAEYSITEKPMSGFKTTYQNHGKHEDVTDRIYNGGTITNTGKDVPRTGDSTPVELAAIALALSMLGLILSRKRRQ